MHNDYVCPQRLTHQGVLKLRLRNKKRFRHGGYTNCGDFCLKICKDWSLQLGEVRTFKTSAILMVLGWTQIYWWLLLQCNVKSIAHHGIHWAPETSFKSTRTIKQTFLSNNPPFSICGTSTIVYQEVCPTSTLEMPWNTLKQISLLILPLSDLLVKLMMLPNPSCESSDIISLLPTCHLLIFLQASYHRHICSMMAYCCAWKVVAYSICEINQAVWSSGCCEIKIWRKFSTCNEC